ncbi:MAG: hypothetical protein K9H61_11135 [Bacteroidia bacterium]|nr:hypothetical protein [Bacteroidia bacterium]MCF8425585.1 hypothetical protein [Bacteroidia bacterium]MCF8447540.1 hypothetical protein [Bacteroidia bacterium]
MFKNILFSFLLVVSFSTYAQNEGTAIGEMNNGVYELNEHQKSLTKAFEWTFRDGTKVTDLKIEQISNTYYLVAQCVYQGHKRMAAVDLDMVGIQFVLNEDAFFKMCSAVACETCRFFLENNKIVACKCEETGTISNHCHYKSLPANGFYANFQRAIKMAKD